MDYSPSPQPCKYTAEALRLEAVTACVGFDDILDYTLEANHPHLDTMIVVTSHRDTRTQLVAKKHGAICVQTDLFTKNGRTTNIGAALNAGMARWQYNGWRMRLDADIALPDNFRRVLFNHTHLDRSTIYGADRVDVVGAEALHALRRSPQAGWSFFVKPGGVVSPRYVDTLRGYMPIGFFQLWHSSCEKPYPFSLGTAATDDVMFAEQWPRENRRLLPTVVCAHLCSRPPTLKENWEGRTSPRFGS